MEDLTLNLKGSAHLKGVKEEALGRIAREIRNVVPGILMMLAFGSVNHGDEPGDIDLAMVVPDGYNSIDTLRALAPVLARQSILNGLLTTCFPIGESELLHGKSQFSRNVRDTGRAI